VDAGVLVAAEQVEDGAGLEVCLERRRGGRGGAFVDRQRAGEVALADAVLSLLQRVVGLGGRLGHGERGRDEQRGRHERQHA
jgi:hypothetical protein